MEYTVTLTEVEQKAMEYVALNVQDWITDAVHNRARQAIDEVAAAEVERMINDPKVRAIPANKNELVTNSKLLNAAERQAAVIQQDKEDRINAKRAADA